MPTALQQGSPRLTSPDAPSTTTEQPFISIIVPVRNEARFITDTLAQLLGQDYPADRYEILVADGRSTDDTRSIVAAVSSAYPHVRLLDNPRRWSSAGRNVAVAAARGEVILLIDGHCQIDDPHYLKNLASAFERSGADSIGRPQPLDIRGASAVQLAIAQARSSWLGHHPDSHIYSDREGFVAPDSVAVAYRSSVFQRIGNFDERFDACEDVEFNHRLARAGMTCYFTPAATVRYCPRESIAKLFRQMLRYGRGRVRLLRKHPETFSVPGFVPGFFLLGLVLGPVLACLFSPLWLVYLGTLALYATLVSAASLQCALRSGQPAQLVLLPAVFVTVHLGAGFGLCWEFLLRLFANRQPEQV